MAHDGKQLNSQVSRLETTGSQVYAGTINQAGTLEVRADRLGKEMTFGKIIEAVERAEHSRAPYKRQQIGSLDTWSISHSGWRFSRSSSSQHPVYDLRHHCGRGLRYRCRNTACHTWRNRTGRAAWLNHQGGIYLEALGQLHIVFLDKTGTLTYGIPLVKKINTASSRLLQVRPDKVDQVFGQLMRRSGISIRRQQMETDVIFQHLGHQAVDTAAYIR